MMVMTAAKTTVASTAMAWMPSCAASGQGHMALGCSVCSPSEHAEIAVVGRGWDPDTGILTLGEVSRRTGIERKLILVVRGPWRKEVEFKPVRVAPSVLKVSLGQRSEINKGAVVQIPLTIDVPKDSPPMNYLGSEQGGLGEIILETAHPQVPKLRILVRFAIEG